MTEKDDEATGEDPRLLNLRAAAHYLGLEDYQLRYLVQNNLVPFMRVGRKLYFTRVALGRWIAEQTTGVQ